MIKKNIAILLLLSFINFINMPVLASVHVKAGRTIPVCYMGEKVSGKHVVSGDIIKAQVQSDVIVDDVVVFRTGDPVDINVSDVKKAKFFGTPGELVLLNGTAQDVNGDNHPISLTYRITGEERNYAKVLPVVSIFFLLPLALFGFVKGGQAELTSGKAINATLLNDFEIEE